MEYHLKFGISKSNPSLPPSHSFGPKSLLKSRGVNLPYLTKSTFRHEIPYKIKHPLYSSLNIENIIDARHVQIHGQNENNEKQFKRSMKSSLLNICTNDYSPSVKKLKNSMHIINNKGNDIEKIFSCIEKDGVMTLNDFFNSCNKSQSQQKLFERRELQKKIKQNQQLFYEMDKNEKTPPTASRRGSAFSSGQSAYRSVNTPSILSSPTNLHLEPIQTIRNLSEQRASPRGPMKVVTPTQNTPDNQTSVTSSKILHNTTGKEGLLRNNRKKLEEAIFLKKMPEKNNPKKFDGSDNVEDCETVALAGFSSHRSLQNHELKKGFEDFRYDGNLAANIVGNEIYNKTKFINDLGMPVFDSNQYFEKESNHKQSNLIKKNEHAKHKQTIYKTKQNLGSIFNRTDNNNTITSLPSQQSNIQNVDQYEIKDEEKELMNNLLKFNETPQKTKTTINNKKENQDPSKFSGSKSIDQYVESNLFRKFGKNISFDNIELSNDCSISYHPRHKTESNHIRVLSQGSLGSEKEIDEKASTAKLSSYNNSNFTSFAHRSNSQSPLRRTNLPNHTLDISPQNNLNSRSIYKFLKSVRKNNFNKNFNRLCDKRIHVHSQLKIGQRIKSNWKDAKYMTEKKVEFSKQVKENYDMNNNDRKKNSIMRKLIIKN